jgi:hypothetical protein
VPFIRNFKASRNKVFARGALIQEIIPSLVFVDCHGFFILTLDLYFVLIFYYIPTKPMLVAACFLHGCLISWWYLEESASAVAIFFYEKKMDGTLRSLVISKSATSFSEKKNVYMYMRLLSQVQPVYSCQNARRSWCLWCKKIVIVITWIFYKGWFPHYSMRFLVWSPLFYICVVIISCLS